MGDEYYDEYYRSFKQAYSCCPLSFLKKSNLENGNKIIMPASALDRLAHMVIDYPMTFEIENHLTGRVSHCGVLEFTGEEGFAFLPNWMMETLQLQKDDLVILKNASLKKGTYIKLQPHTKDFTNLSNPRDVLETALRNFSCLTIGETIMIPYNEKKFYIDIVETKPSPAIIVTETDCEVDFAPSLDWKTPKKPARLIPSKNAPAKEEPAKEEPKFRPFTGTSIRLDGKPAPKKSTELSKENAEAKNIMTEETKPKFRPFKGVSRYLDEEERPSFATIVASTATGNLVSSNVIPSPNESTELSKENVKVKTTKNKEPKPKFRPFTGVSRRLGGEPSTNLAAPLLEEHPLVASKVTSMATGKAHSTKDLRRQRVRKEKKASRNNSNRSLTDHNLLPSSIVIEAPKESTELSQENVKEKTMNNKEPNPKFRPFTGVSRCLNEELSTDLAAPLLEEHPLVASKVTSMATGKAHSTKDSRRRRVTKASRNDSSRSLTEHNLLSSSIVIEAPKESTELSKENVEAKTIKNEEPKFQPFTGKKYTLTS